MGECIRSCEYYRVSMDGMECGHPYFNDKGVYDNMIISQDDRGGYPKDCPLRKDNLNLPYGKDRK